MASITGIEKIVNDDSNIALQVQKTIKRLNDYPLDTTEVFLSEDAAKAYASGKETSSKNQNGATAYVGQTITVVNKDNGTAQSYQIQDAAGTLAKIMKEPLAGQEFDLDSHTLRTVLTQLIVALGGTVKTKAEKA